MKIIALIFLIFNSPLFIFLFIVLKLFGKGPAIFKQVRIGKNKKEFTIYKFRTMSNGAITPIGRIMRKLGLDELPQLVNIIKGDMSFVGPRPLTQYDIDRLEWSDEKFIARWSVKPGITGPAQLVTICDKNISMKEDLKYVISKSLSLDIKIFIKSMFIPLLGKRKKVNK